MVVAIECAGGRVASHIDIGPAIIVVIKGGGCHRITTLDLGDARAGGNICEGAVSVVVQEEVGVCRQPFRAAVDRDSLPGTVGAFTWLRSVGEIKLQIEI